MSVTIGSASWTIEAAFGDPPLTATASNTWTDITAYVRSLVTRRGRSHSLDRVQTGSCTLVLSNADRRFDPTHSGGAYYGDLLPNVKIRVSVTHNAVTYRVGVFYVNGWPQSYDEGNTDSTVTVTAGDAFKLLASHNLDESLFTSLLRSLRPVHWWRLDENPGTKRLTDSGSAGLNVDVVGKFADTTLGLGNDGLDAGGTATAFKGTFATTSPGPVQPQYGEADGPLSTWEWLVCLVSPRDADDTGDDGYLLASLDDFTVYLDNSSGGTVDDHTANFKRTVGATALAGGARKCIVVKRQAGAAPTVWVDGVSTGTSAASTTAAWARTTILGAYLTAPDGYGGTAQHLALLDDAPADGTVEDYAELLTLFANASTPTTTGTQVGRVLDIVGWASADRDLDTGGKSLTGSAPNGTSALAYLQLLEVTEQGLLFAAGDGDLTFIDVDALRSVARHITSQTTFSDDGSDVPVHAGRISFTYDDDLICNVVDVTGVGIATQRATDTASITSYGERAETITTALTDERAARHLAEYRVLRRAQPLTRPDAFTVKPEHDAATIYPSVCDLEIGDAITVERTPQGTGSQIAIAAVVDSIAWRITQDHDVSVTFTASPADQTDWFTWGTSEWGGSHVWSY